MFNKVSSEKQKMFKTKDVLAVAFAAHRINNGYIKFGSYDYHKNIIVSKANKTIVKEYFGRWGRDEERIRITITEKDTANVEIACKHFNKYTINLLANTLSDFQKDLFEAITAEHVSNSQLGILAYVPEMMKREMIDAELKRTVKQSYTDSKHIGAKGEKFEGVCKIISKQYHAQYERYIYTVEHQGNILSFFCQFDLAGESDRLIKGKIKDHVVNKKLKVNETRLNYVKTYNAAN